MDSEGASARKDESCRNPTDWSLLEPVRWRTALAQPSMLDSGIESISGSIATTCLSETWRPHARWKKRLLKLFVVWCRNCSLKKWQKREAFWDMDVKNTRLRKSVLPCVWGSHFGISLLSQQIYHPSFRMVLLVARKRRKCAWQWISHQPTKPANKAPNPWAELPKWMVSNETIHFCWQMTLPPDLFYLHPAAQRPGPRNSSWFKDPAKSCILLEIMSCCQDMPRHDMIYRRILVIIYIYTVNKYTCIYIFYIYIYYIYIYIYIYIHVCMSLSLSLSPSPSNTRMCACVCLFIHSFIYWILRLKPTSAAICDLHHHHHPKDPYPFGGGGRGGTKPTCRILLFFAWKPWDSDPTPQTIFKNNMSIHFLTSLGQFLRLAPEELSTSMMTAAQFLEGCHPYTCAASVWHVLSSSRAKRKYLIFICLPMIWNDEECWSLRNKNAILWNFKMKIQYDSPPQISFFRG